MSFVKTSTRTVLQVCCILGAFTTTAFAVERPKEVKLTVHEKQANKPSEDFIMKVMLPADNDCSSIITKNARITYDIDICRKSTDKDYITLGVQFRRSERNRGLHREKKFRLQSKVRVGKSVMISKINPGDETSTELWAYVK